MSGVFPLLMPSPSDAATSDRERREKYWEKIAGGRGKGAPPPKSILFRGWRDLYCPRSIAPFSLTRAPLFRRAVLVTYYAYSAVTSRTWKQNEKKTVSVPSANVFLLCFIYEDKRVEVVSCLDANIEVQSYYELFGILLQIYENTAKLSAPHSRWLSSGSWNGNILCKMFI